MALKGPHKKKRLRARTTPDVAPVFTPAERRAARAARIRVDHAEPCGWIARSEDDENGHYHLHYDPKTRRLSCSCADFHFRSRRNPNFECKHITATLIFIARDCLARHYKPVRPISAARRAASEDSTT